MHKKIALTSTHRSGVAGALGAVAVTRRRLRREGGGGGGVAVEGACSTGGSAGGGTGLGKKGGGHCWNVKCIK